MEIKICCDAQVKLEKMTNVMEVECVVDDYQIEGDTLNGNILIRGSYVKDNFDEYFDFKEIVPFTVVLNDKGYVVDGISIQDFTCQEIINQGIECNFNILVSYHEEDSVIDLEIEDFNDINVEPMEVETKDDSKDDTLEIEDVNGYDEKIEEIEVETDEDIIEVSDDDIKKEIDKKYDKLLQEILEARKDQNFLEKTENVAVRSNEVSSDCRSVLSKIPSEYASYRVYYTKKESDIERIAKSEHISVSQIYKDNKEVDIKDKRRIILK